MGLDVGLILVGLIYGQTVKAPAIKVIDEVPDIDAGLMIKGCKVGPYVAGPEMNLLDKALDQTRSNNRPQILDGKTCSMSRLEVSY